MRRVVYPCLEGGCGDGQTKARLCRCCIGWKKDETWDLEGRGKMQARREATQYLCAGSYLGQGVGRKVPEK